MTHDFDVDRSPAGVAVGDDDRFECFTDLELAALPPQRAIIENLLYEETLATVIGRWASFKSFIALEMAFCIATGEPYHGRAVTHGAVIYFAGEGRHGIAKRMTALRMKYNIGSEIPLVFCFASADVGNPAEVSRALHMADLKLQAGGLAYLPIVGVFIDTLAAHMPGNENGSEEMKRYIEGCKYIRRRTGACVASVHHSGWSDEIRSRGSSTLPAGVDTEITVERDGDRVVLKNKKQKDEQEHEEFSLEASKLGDSLVFSSVVPRSSKLTPNELRILQEVPTLPGIGFKACLDATGLSKGSFDRARKRLLELCYVRQHGEKYVVTDAGRMALSTRYQAGTTEVPR